MRTKDVSIVFQLDYCYPKLTNQIASLEVTIRDSYLARGNIEMPARLSRTRPLLRVVSHSKCHAQLRACARAVV